MKDIEIRCAKFLGIIKNENGHMTLVGEPNYSIETWLIDKVKDIDILKSTIRLINANAGISTYEIGEAIQQEYNYKDWSKGSLRRYGSALNVWAMWIINFDLNPLLL